jgi:AcrR family transcriptional regulator
MKRAQYDAQLILNRSYDLFNEGGLVSLKVRAVAKVCHCSVIPIYRCFQSRNELCKAVLNQSFSIFEKDLLKEIETHKTDSHDPYWRLYSALSRQYGLIKEVISGNMKIIDELAQITHKHFSNKSTYALRAYIQLICMILNIRVVLVKSF